MADNLRTHNEEFVDIAAGRSVGQPLWRKRHLPAFGETPCTHAVSRRFEHLRKEKRLY
ncbi:MAG: hypothetical protein IK990_18275 [Ruminiclostridium sp.]|nr:hypothetical protein [Ruminiclostridium sp.]